MNEITEDTYFSKMESKKNQYGLVLSGGAGKGAYEVGVWKALNEMGIAEKITGFSGTSVGALNSALFVSNISIDEIIKIWYDFGPLIESDDVLKFMLTIANIVKSVAKFANKDYVGAINDAASSIRKVAESHGGVCSQEKIEDVFKKIDLSCSTGKVIYSCVADTTLRSIKRAYISWEGHSKQQIGKIITSSAGLPLIYPIHKGERPKHWMFDGGVGYRHDNTPIAPLWYEGYRNIIVVYLENDKKYLNKHKRLERKLYPNTNIIRIIPSAEFHKGLKARGNTDPKRIEDNIELGERNTKELKFELKTFDEEYNRTLYEKIDHRIWRGEQLIPKTL